MLYNKLKYVLLLFFILSLFVFFVSKLYFRPNLGVVNVSVILAKSSKLKTVQLGNENRSLVIRIWKTVPTSHRERRGDRFKCSSLIFIISPNLEKVFRYCSTRKLGTQMDSVTLQKSLPHSQAATSLKWMTPCSIQPQDNLQNQTQETFYVGRAKTTYFSSFLMDGKANNVFQFQFISNSTHLLLKQVSEIQQV